MSVVSEQSFNSDERFPLYINAVDANRWSIRTYNLLLKKSKRNISRMRWTAITAHYFADLVNFPEDNEDIFAGLVSFTCRISGLETKEVEDIFSATPVFTTQSRIVPQMIVKRDHVEIFPLKFYLPENIIQTMTKDKNFDLTLLRYAPLNTETGYFLSIEPRLYDLLSRSSMRVLECFASPFNYNLDNFCSVYPEDMELTYPEGVRCYGNFLSYIDVLKEDKNPCRLIVNPPYTDRIINKVGEKISEYFGVHPDSEVFCLLPDWTPQEGIEKIMSLPGSVSTHISITETSDNPFTMYSFSQNKSVIMKEKRLLAICNFQSNKELSSAALDSIITTMKSSKI